MKKTPQTDVDAHTFPVGEQVLIPLNRLKASPRNVRKTPHSAASLEAYAASIAAKGILQNLVVEPEHEDATPTGFYLVTIGEGRRRAQNLRVERGEIPDDEPIPCVIDVRRDPQEISLDENITREAMHPADQFEAFRALVEVRGFSPEDIAARFGVTARTVQQRLRLSAVAPSLIQAYREAALSLEQLMAFAITDDHARQEAVFARLSSWTSEPYHIRRLLTETQVAARDRRARFVGAEAYVEAGGRIERDLFTEDDGGYFSDPALLDQLALAKLAAEAETVRAEEGWAWAQAHLDYPHGLACRRAYPQTRLLSEDEQAARHKAQADYDALYAEWSDQDEVPEDVLARFAALEADLDRFERLSIAFAPEDVARGGLIVSLAHDGAIRIERGLIRPEDAVAEVGAPDNQGDAANHSGDSGDKIRESGEDADAQSASARADDLSADLTRDLSARRTLALRGVLAGQPELATRALTHKLVLDLFFPHAEHSCLDLRIGSPYVDSYADGLADGPDALLLQDRHANWAEQLPDAPDVWDWIMALEAEALGDLLAHCVALSVSLVQQPHDLRRGQKEAGNRLAQAAKLDMRRHWTATARGYFERVTKAQCLSTVREACGDEVAARLKGLKKAEMALAAEQALAGTHWLPPLLRARDEGANQDAMATGFDDKPVCSPDAAPMATAEAA